MTFYWWSHWFWITLISVILSPIIIVHTYPSQEISLEYNQNSKPLQKAVTKLYQTTTALTWVTVAPPTSPLNNKTPSTEKTVLKNITLKENIEADDMQEEASAEVELNEDRLEVGQQDHLDVIEDVEGDVEVDDEAVQEGDASLSDEYEFKRSAENYNNTKNDEGKSNRSEILQAAEVLNKTKLKTKEADLNNYTNFSRATNDKSKNNATESDLNSGNSNTTMPLTSSAEKPQLTIQDTTLSSSALRPTSAPAPPAPPHIDSAANVDRSDNAAAAATHVALDWFNAMAAQLPPAHVTINDDSEPVTVPHRIPFTLENVNKEDELRRAENEHRSRKSKVLSGDYKHINRYINFSTDSKSLLTRSASAAPNEFDDEGEESNISSEALSIQRTYFLDAGAISAICFTIFGVCCTVGTIGVVLYRRRYFNKPQALSEPDSSVYIDDSTMRASDNSDEMYSLDNDSFLNSLEAMTIQNYWTDTVKHTKL